MTSAAEPTQAEVLDGFLKAVKGMAGGGHEAVVIFDLDDTLLSTAPRHIRILREYAAVRPLGEAAEANLRRLSPEDVQYSIIETAKAAGVGAAETLEDLRRFWFERFFKNEYLLADEPVAGAVAYSQELAAAGAPGSST